MGTRSSVRKQVDQALSSHAATVRSAVAEGTRRAVDALPRSEREALMLWNGGSTYHQIAEQMCESPDAVGGFLTRARNRLVAASDLLHCE